MYSDYCIAIIRRSLRRRHRVIVRADTAVTLSSCLLSLLTSTIAGNELVDSGCVAGDAGGLVGSAGWVCVRGGLKNVIISAVRCSIKLMVG
eukprot:scaffold505187_cov14-Prasinocladus_malaysianus.AAC.1